MAGGEADRAAADMTAAFPLLGCGNAQRHFRNWRCDPLLPVMLRLGIGTDLSRLSRREARQKNMGWLDRRPAHSLHRNTTIRKSANWVAGHKLSGNG